MKYFGPILIGLLVPIFLAGQSKSADAVAVKRTFDAVKEIAEFSYPEIKLEKLRVKAFRSDDSFFKARYSLFRYLTFQRMRHLVFVNPDAFERSIPENAFRAIIAHELAHVAYYTRKNRLQLLGLVRLASRSSRIDFERKADLDAIRRGYGLGLIEYREWLYKQISDKEVARKKHVYFSPPEIRLLMRATVENPDLIDRWLTKVPRNIEEIKRDSGYE